MTTRRDFLGAVASFAATGPDTAFAQRRPVTLPRIAFLHPGATDQSAVYKTVVPQLADLGYVDGKTVSFVTRSGLGDPANIPRLVAEIVNLDVTVFVVFGPNVTGAATAATKKTPILAVDLESDPCERDG